MAAGAQALPAGALRDVVARKGPDGSGYNETRLGTMSTKPLITLEEFFRMPEMTRATPMNSTGAS